MAKKMTQDSLHLRTYRNLLSFQLNSNIMSIKIGVSKDRRVTLLLTFDNNSFNLHPIINLYLL